MRIRLGGGGGQVVPLLAIGFVSFDQCGVCVEDFFLSTKAASVPLQRG